MKSKANGLLSKSKSESASFVINNPDQTGVWGEVFTASSPSLKTRNNGTIFGLIVLPTKAQKAKTISQKIITTVKEAFFSINPEESLDLEDQFERVLRKTNQEIIRLIQKEGTNWLSGFSALIGAVKGNELYLCPRGNVSSFLIQQYRIFNILELCRWEAEESKPNPFKTFSSIINGEVKGVGNLFFCNDAVLDFVSQEKIRKIINENGVGKSAQEIANLLPANLKKCLVGLVIKTIAESKKIKEAALPPLPREGLKTIPEQELTLEEEEAAHLMSPIFTKDLAKKTLGAVAGAGRSLGSLVKSKISYGKSYSPPSLERIQRIKSGPKLFTKTTRMIGRFVIWFWNLSRKQKLIFALALVLAFFFIKSLAQIGSSNEGAMEKEVYDNLVRSIEEKIELAQTALIYQDNKKAKNNLLEAQELLNALPNKSRKEKKQFVELEKEIKQPLQEVFKIKSLAAPVLLAGLAGLEPETANWQMVLLNNNDSYAASPATGTIYKFSAEQNQFHSIKESLGILGGFEKMIPAEEKLIFILNNKKIAEFIPPDKLNPVSGDIKSVSDFVFYNNRFYGLDAVNQQIWRYQQIEDNLNLETGWLKETANISDAISLAIDGSVYVLKSNNEILKLRKGQKETLEFTIEPPPVNLTKIWTNYESKYLYLLDTGSKRIIILTKEGKIAAQYTSPQFASPTSFAVNEKENKIYVLDGAKIYEFEAEYLEQN